MPISPPRSRAELAAFIDHTLLAPEATGSEVADTVAEAAALGCRAVCLSPSQLPVTVPKGLLVATVCGFPSGAHSTRVKVTEAAESYAQGADEVDLVIDLTAAREGRIAEIERQILAVRTALPAPTVLKVIVESALLDDAQLAACCRASEAAGADFVKTSTGYHPAGGASIHAVGVMAATVGGRLGIKASGGIRDTATALALISAGATRLGCSRSRAVIDGLPDA